MADKKKLYKRLALAVIVVGVLFPVKYLQSSDNAFHRAVVFTDPITGDWNCVIPPAGGAPQLTVIKIIHVGGTESEIDNAAPPSQHRPTVSTSAKTEPLTYSQQA